MNNAALDVAIGLVLIYLLYSLLVTILSEIIASKIGLRARILRLSIERMLNDGADFDALFKKHYSKKEKRQHWWRKFFTTNERLFDASFAGAFYNYPSIKYLSKVESSKRYWVKTISIFSQNRPSYILPETFADTVISLLMERGSGNTDAEKIQHAITFNTHLIHPSSLKNIANIFRQANGDKAAFRMGLMKWYTETQDRTTGWYKKRMQMVSLLIGFVIAAAMNVNTISIARILLKDKDARAKMVELGSAIAKDTARYAHFTGISKDSITQAVLDTTYKRLERDINETHAILGTGWTLDTLSKPYEKDLALERSPSVSGVLSLVPLLNKFRDSLAIAESIVAARRNVLDTIFLEYRIAALDTEHHYQLYLFRGNDSAQKKFDTATRKFASVRYDHSQAAIALKKSEAYRTFFENRYKQVVHEIDSLAEGRFSSIEKIDTTFIKTPHSFMPFCSQLIKNDSILKQWIADGLKTKKDTSRSMVIYGRRKASAFEKMQVVACRSFKRENFWGLLITAIMLSFGAPFWFDLLRKMVNIRMAGANPDEKKRVEAEKAPPTPSVAAPSGNVNPAAPAPPSLLPKPVDAVDDTLLKHGDSIMKLTGVTSVYKYKEGDAKKIAVNVADETAKERVEHYLADQKINVIDPGNIHVARAAVTHVGSGKEGQIYNASKGNGMGSLGCVVRKKLVNDGVFYILSCWHVLKGDERYSQDDDKTLINDENNKSLAIRMNGFIGGSVDYGLARCLPAASKKDNSFLTAKFTNKMIAAVPRSVTQDDIDKNIPVHFLNMLTGTVEKGILFTDSAKVTINYVDMPRDITDVLLLTRSPSQRKSISERGNSGAVVFDDKNNAIAMVIGGDAMYTYAIRLSNVFVNQPDLELVS